MVFDFPLICIKLFGNFALGDFQDFILSGPYPRNSIYSFFKKGNSKMQTFSSNLLNIYSYLVSPEGEEVPKGRAEEKLTPQFQSKNSHFISYLIIS